MNQDPALHEWLADMASALTAGELVKLRLSKPAPTSVFTAIDIRPIMVKRALKLSFTYHEKTRDIVKNYAPTESMALLEQLLSESFSAALCCSTQEDVRLQKNAGAFTLTRLPPSHTATPELSHDKLKTRLLESEGKPYLHALGITDAKGNVYKTTQGKFRQINKYIEILDGLIKQLPPRDVLRLVDMGAGKGYLTFALYDYAANTLKLNVEIIGVEARADLVVQCNKIARDSGFNSLRFVQGTIAEYDCSGVDAVIALHACDTATDDAIFKAIRAGAQLIVVAPCCHKQIRRDMVAVDSRHPLHPLMQHGTYAERMAEMITDSVRAQLMEISGYRSNVFEFIGGEHTPKNVMIVATKLAAPRTAADVAKRRTALAETKAHVGVTSHRLEQLLASSA
jgi:hypothetical protein